MSLLVIGVSLVVLVAGNHSKGLTGRFTGRGVPGPDEQRHQVLLICLIKTINYQLWLFRPKIFHKQYEPARHAGQAPS
jgi:hypothetical protein